MSALTKWIVIISAAMFMTACQEKGPMEELGEDVDEAIEETEQAVDDACEDVKESVDADDTDC